MDSLDIALDQYIDCLSEPTEESFSHELSFDDDIWPCSPQKLSIRDIIEIFWPLTDTSYRGNVSEFDHNAGMYGINYDYDGDCESLIMKDEAWRPLKCNKVK